MIVKYLLASILLFQVATPAHIVVWQGVGTHSTRISMWPLMEALISKGHNVTFISPFKFQEDRSTSRVNSILPQKLHAALGSSWEDQVNFFEIRKTLWGLAMAWYDIREFGVLACEALHDDEEFLKWARSPDTKVDLVIVEFSVNDCAYGFAHLWRSKLVFYSTGTVLSSMIDAHGLPDESSSIPDFIFGYKSGKMSFWQRFLNGVQPIVYSLTRDWFYFPRLEEITRKGLGLREGELPSFKEIERNTSLVFITSHYSYGEVRSLPPNVKAVGGVVVYDKSGDLTSEMQWFIESGKEGFIFISFGTVTDFLHFDPEVQLEFIRGLEAFPEMRFVWKLGKVPSVVESLPKNVFVTKWAPQQKLLGHPKIRAFISHVGMGSTAEAFHYSVPLICLPVMCDQDLNANAIEDRGAGIKLEVLTLKRAELEGAIRDILTNPKYREAMNRLSRIFKDRPTPPLEEAVWWVEYVLRHENVHELVNPPSAHQPWWKRRQIDVWLVSMILIAGVTLTLLKSLMLLANFALRICGMRNVDRERSLSTKMKVN